MTYTNNINTLCEKQESCGTTPEASVVEYMHVNTETLRGIDHMTNELYTCLYGAMESTSAPPRTDAPTCFTDELMMQRQMISNIHYTLALICTKLGM